MLWVAEGAVEMTLQASCREPVRRVRVVHRVQPEKEPKVMVASSLQDSASWPQSLFRSPVRFCCCGLALWGLQGWEGNSGS